MTPEKGGFSLLAQPGILLPCFSPFILAMWTPVPSPPATTNKRNSLTDVLCFSQVKEEKEDLKWPSVFSGVSVHISSLRSLTGPHLLGGYSYLWTACVGHCPESWHLDLTPHCYIPVLSLLPDPWVLTCFLYPLSLTGHLTSTGISRDHNFSKKNVTVEGGGDKF